MVDLLIVGTEIIVLCMEKSQGAAEAIEMRGAYCKNRSP